MKNMVVESVKGKSQIMKNTFIMFIFIFAGGLSYAEKPPQRVDAKNETSISFDDLLVKGKFHFSDEAVVTVEDDKILDALLGVRKDFKDRIERSASRR